MKLTRLLIVATTLLATLVCAMLGRILWGEWNHYTAASDGLHTLQLVQRAMTAAEKLSVERGPVNGVLGDPLPGDPAKQARLRTARAASDQALLELELAVAMHAGDMPGLRAAAHLAALQRALQQARHSVDQLAAQPLPARGDAQLTATIEQMFALVPRVLDTVTAYTGVTEQAYPRIGKILMKARFAVELREYAGRLGSRLTVALAAQQPLSETEHAQLQFLRGQVEQLRRLLELPATTVDDDPRVQAALRAMNQHYFGRGLALIDGIEQASRAGRPYGLDTSQLALRYVPLMAPILQVRDALLQAALDQAMRDFDAARRELWLACLTGLMILLALTLLVLIMRRRVVLPLLGATRAIVRLGRGDFGATPAGTDRPDEVGDLMRALASLRQASLDKQQLEQERGHLIEELKLSAETDYLTGILNRRAFTAAGNQRLRRAQEQQLSLAVILFDVDHFKAVNDRYGHDVGDQVLIQISAMVRTELRDGEVLARYGGEEFVVMPGHCDLATAHVVAERLRRAIAAAPLRLANGQLLTVTASFGVAASDQPQTTLDSLFQAADLALYRAKHRGRNCVES
ncbi:MAG: diguanylate cyclase [Sphingomonadaceae bacterium]